MSRFSMNIMIHSMRFNSIGMASTGTKNIPVTSFSLNFQFLKKTLFTMKCKVYESSVTKIVKKYACFEEKSIFSRVNNSKNMDLLRKCHIHFFSGNLSLDRFLGSFWLSNLHPREGEATAPKVRAPMGTAYLLFIDNFPMYSQSFQIIGSVPNNSEGKTFIYCNTCIFV